ncbi:MAG: protein kinase [Chloroflexi bacterium]|nr:protein kinase [Chloroflexota bacterium]
MPLQEGQNIGPYRIVELLGQGGMATVYKAYHTRLDRHVALKVMHQALLEDPTFRARFQREAQIVARLEHPHIVPVYDYDEHEGQPFLILKQIEGRTLKAAMVEGALSLDEQLRIMTAIAGALDYAHSKGVLHRDFKPSNIIIDPEGTPYLADFGLARMAQSGASTMSADMLLGTPHYISPEQAKGEADLDARTDVYSFGVVLYEMLTGRVPFGGTTPYAIVHDHIYSAVPLPTSLNPNIPAPVEAVLLKALAKTPAERYASAGELVLALRAALDGQTSIISAPPHSLPPGETRSLSADAPPPAAEPGEQPARKPLSSSRIIDIRMPDTQKRFVQVPTPPPARVDTSLDSVFSEVGSRLKEVGLQIRDELQRSGVLDQIKEGVARAQQQYAQQQAQAGGRIPSPIQHIPAARAVEQEWGGDEEAVRRRVRHQGRRRSGLVGHIIGYLVTIGILSAIWGGVEPALISGLQNDLPAWAIQLIELLPVPLLMALGWGIALAQHFVDALANTAGRINARRRAVFSKMQRIYGQNWQEDASDQQYRRVRRSVQEGIDQRIGFFHHFVAFVMINLMLLTIWGTANPALQEMARVEMPDQAWLFSFPLPLIITFFWGFGLAFNGIAVLLSPLFGREADERTLEQELARERERSLAVGKRKNQAPLEGLEEAAAPPLRLTEEGEFTDSFAQELNEQERRQRGG